MATWSIFENPGRGSDAKQTAKKDCAEFEKWRGPNEVPGQGINEIRRWRAMYCQDSSKATAQKPKQNEVRERPLVDQGRLHVEMTQKPRLKSQTNSARERPLVDRGRRIVELDQKPRFKSQTNSARERPLVDRRQLRIEMAQKPRLKTRANSAREQPLVDQGRLCVKMAQKPKSRAREVREVELKFPGGKSMNLMMDGD